MSFSTKAIHAGYKKDSVCGALATPIYQSSTFIFDSAEQGGRRFALEEEGYIYTRLGNPTQSQLEEKIAMLENGESAMAAASGMGAISAALWTVLKAGDHVLADKTLYGCTFELLNHGLTRFGVEVTFIDASDLEEVKNGMRKNTKVVYLETPANPDLKLVDIEEIAKIVHNINNECLVFVDNTFATPYLQKPLDLGADVVVHSATKYLNGHGDVIAGIVVGTKEFINNVRFFGIKDMTGAVISPFDSYLIIRGMKTLQVRMDRHCKNALEVSKFLESHENVEKISYPGLESFPQYELAKKQMKLPASMTHSPYSQEERLETGITDGLIRLSVGLEDVEDIIYDLKQGLDNL